ncbi:cation-translocating P-type ATPase [Flindersiella endophytica]
MRTERPGDLDASVRTLPVSRVFDRLETSASGLSAGQVAERARRYGPNTLPKARRRSPVLLIAKQFTDLFAIVLLAASVITYAVFALSEPPDARVLYLAVAIDLVVVLNALIGFGQEYSAERTVEALQAMVPRASRVLRDGERSEVPAADLVPGDVLVLEAGDSVPADSRLVEAHTVRVDNAPLTGESTPVRRSVDPSPPGTPALETGNCVFMGTTVVAGTAKAVVYAIGAATEFGRIYRLTAEAPRQQTPLQRQVVSMARRVSGIALAIGAVLFGIRTATGHQVLETFIFALGVMVACVPEGLPATLSVALAVGVRRMARRNALVKQLLAVEALGSTTVICTDKTGTLTQAEMTVQRCWASGSVHAVSGIGYSPRQGAVEDPEPVRQLLRQAALCSNARLLPPAGEDDWRILGDPTEGALLVAAAKADVDVAGEEAKSPRVLEFPFDSARKLMTTVHRIGELEYEAYIKGAPDELVERCTRIAWNGRLLPLDDELRAQVKAADDTMARESLRVLGVACRALDDARPDQKLAESDLTFVGLVGMLDPPRPEVTDAVTAARRAGIRVVMVTGDYPLTAEAIARRVGIVRGPAPVVVTGGELAGMDELALRQLLASPAELLFCRVSPEDKMRIVATLQGLDEVVAVTGDGANDAPALKRADIGVAMGAGGTDVAREAAEMVLLDDSFASIVAAIELGRSVYLNARKFLVYVFCSNLGELSPIVVATFLGFPLVPVSAVQVLAIDLGTDVAPALALGMEPPESDTMNRPPRPRKEAFFSAAVIRRILFLGGVEAVASAGVFFWLVGSSGIGFEAFTSADPVYRHALTLAHATIVIAQIFVGFAVRTDRQSILQAGVLSNPRYVLAQLLSVGMLAAVSYLPILQSVFNTVPLTAADWLTATVLGSLVLIADEVRKLYLRGKERSTP